MNLAFNSVNLSLNDLSYVSSLKRDNETLLCGVSYWAGIEKDVKGCNFKQSTAFVDGQEMKGIVFVTDIRSSKN